MRLLTVVAAVAAIINNAVLAAPMPEVPEPTITPTPTYLNQTYVYYPQATDWCEYPS
jgi:hypothetical protein